MLPLIEAKCLANVLGTVIVNNVLPIGAWGVVVLAGGIMSQLAPLIDKSQLAMRIQKIGKESHLTASSPVWLSVDPHAGLRWAQAGLSNALLREGKCTPSQSKMRLHLLRLL